jgi:hypothetical protein
MITNRLSCILTLLISFSVAAAATYAGEKSASIQPNTATGVPFTDAELKQASPFNPEIIRRTFVAVAHEMHISIDADIPFPDIVVSSQIPVEKMPAYLGLKLSSNLVNYFGYLKNTVVLNDNARIHQLAHEFVHYFQFHYYLKGDIKRLTCDPEPEAVRIQNRFRS